MPLNAPVLSAAKVGVGVSGSLAFGPTGTTLPTSTTGSLNAAIREMGYLTEDGLTEHTEVEREGIPLWQNAAQARETPTGARFFFAGTFAETNVPVIEAVYGTTVTQTATHGSYEIDPAKSSGRGVGVATILDGQEVKVITSADCEIFKAGAVEYKNGVPIGYPFEMVCYDKPMVYDTRLRSA